MKNSPLSFSISAVLSAAVSLVFLVPQMALATAPVVLSFSPGDGANNVATNRTSISITFDQVVQGHTGNITLYKKLANGSWASVQATAGNDAAVTGTGTATLTLALSPSISVANTEFHVEIASTAVRNGASEFYAGITSATTWNFSTPGGGGSGAREARAARWGAAPTYTDREPPSLSDVGIFVPEKQANAAPVGGTPIERPKHEMTEEAKKMSEKLLKAMKGKDNKMMETQTIVPSTGGQTYSSSLQQRACDRVARLFANDRKMIDRVNERLKKRFSFTCDL